MQECEQSIDKFLQLCDERRDDLNNFIHFFHLFYSFIPLCFSKDIAGKQTEVYPRWFADNFLFQRGYAQERKESVDDLFDLSKEILNGLNDLIPHDKKPPILFTMALFRAPPEEPVVDWK